MNMNHQGDREFVLSVVKYKEGKCNEQITMVVSSLKYENLNPSPTPFNEHLRATSAWRKSTSTPPRQQIWSDLSISVSTFACCDLDETNDRRVRKKVWHGGWGRREGGAGGGEGRRVSREGGG
ncbi:hypothetical protein Fmac_010555 [Flemingia macrophylla]|uniref:Uncharacterized protein n=1 Tax=Flemingia macrophylla TaxID=520843 RepID=A0ABD1MK28_9FABA